MQVILLTDIVKLGDKDDVVNVKPGYANNYLIPQGLALPATESNIKVLAERVKQAQHKQEKIRTDAQRIADQLSILEFKIPMIVGKDGKIFGSVTARQLSNVMREKGHDIDHRKILLPEDIKLLGEYSATIHLHKDVKPEIKFEVVANQ
jgi:large subunit ribosomal protein L9